MAEHQKFITLTPKLYDYLIAHGHNGDPLRAELAAETAKLGMISGMQIAAEQGTLMAVLAGAIGARSAVEVGTFTGYSALCVARALPADGKLLCCDINQEWTSIGRRYWERAGVANKITLKLAPAAETLKALPASHTFDFAFIDADKTSYAIYYEEILKRLRTNGLIHYRQRAVERRDHRRGETGRRHAGAAQAQRLHRERHPRRSRNARRRRRPHNRAQKVAARAV